MIFLIHIDTHALAQAFFVDERYTANCSEKVQGTYVLGVYVEARLHELLEWLGVVAGQLGRIAVRDEPEHAHRMELAVRWFAFRQFDRRDAQRPSIGLQKFSPVILRVLGDPELARLRLRVAAVSQLWLIAFLGWKLF